MMRKEDIDRYATRKPFLPFEVRLVDGQRFRFSNIEQFLVGRNTLAALTKTSDISHISLGLISTIGPASKTGRRRSRGNR